VKSRRQKGLRADARAGLVPDMGLPLQPPQIGACGQPAASEDSLSPVVDNPQPKPDCCLRVAIANDGGCDCGRVVNIWRVHPGDEVVP
jgi:hypothetical protein